jgi:hypothetical protein
MHHGLRYVGDGELMLHGFVDSDWVGDAGGKKSTLCFFFSLGSCMIYWFSREKALVALSSIEVEYMASNFASCEAI